MPHHKMRRHDREITDAATIERILTQGKYVTIALADADEPYAVTLSYGYEPDTKCLYFHAAREGRKMDIIAKNPRACATIVCDSGYNQGECEHPFESVVMFGTMRRLDEDAEKRHAIHVLVRHLEDDPEAYWDSRKWALDERIGGFSALAFDIERLSAKRGQ